jgi:hypothetical protein
VRLPFSSSSSTSTADAALSTEYYYETKTANSDEIVFEAEVREGSQGKLAVSYLRSRQYDLGKARCVVGEQSAVLDGYWGSSACVPFFFSSIFPRRFLTSFLPQRRADAFLALRIVNSSLAQTQVIAKGLPPGLHRVSCRTLPVQAGDKSTSFRLMGVMTV